MYVDAKRMYIHPRRQISLDRVGGHENGPFRVDERSFIHGQDADRYSMGLTSKPVNK